MTSSLQCNTILFSYTGAITYFAIIKKLENVSETQTKKVYQTKIDFPVFEFDCLNFKKTVQGLLFFV